MDLPVFYDIMADRRAAFLRKVAFVGYDFTGATKVMEVRQTKDTTGTALIRLENVGSYSQGLLLNYAGTAIVSDHITAGRLTAGIYNTINPATGVNYVAGDSVLMSVVWIIADAATMSALPFPEERGEDATFYYDMIVSSGTLLPEVYLAGKFVVRAGVTIP